MMTPRRNLLWLGLLLPGVVVLPLLATAGRDEAPAPDVRLAGIIEQEGHPVRIIISHGNGDSEVLAEGERLDRCRFIGLEGRYEARFRCGDQGGYRLTLNGVEQPAQGSAPIPEARVIRLDAARLEAVMHDQQRLVEQFDVVPLSRDGQVEAWLVRFVAAGSLAAEAGLRAGDEIVSLNGVPVRQADAFMRMLHALGQRPVVTLGLRRAQRPLSLTYILQ